MRMFARKMISAYGATAAMAFFMAYTMSDGYGAGSGLLAVVGITALTASPVVFLYGSVISVFFELATKRIPNRPVGLVISGLGHAGFGALFASAVNLTPFFNLAFAATALAYFLIDLLQQLTEGGPHWGKVIAALLAWPIAAAAVVILTY
ncbi:hypothetical protein [Paenibacillus soyae]|uniref:Uncharacterized protein n=1 Tax=Paenibacillus soyae TaxID=2969249 RepID=A0A9X2MQT2_9BACL|nr:hypothetical protein [Paenibacillus soyae]MCR2805166.1 hypothetical protein [Paenibacillus soyae]